jgi:hypothetical protein
MNKRRRIRQYNGQKKKDQTIQWTKEEGQTIQWTKEEGQTMQWTKEEGSDNTMDKTRTDNTMESVPSSFVHCIV